MRIFTLIAILIAPLGVAAVESPSVDVSPETKMVLNSPNLSLEKQGKSIWSAVIEGAAADGKGTLTLHELAGGLKAVHARVSSKTGTIETVVLMPKKKKKPKVIWSEATTLKGDIGERIGKAVRFDDLTGDNLPEIIVGEVSEMVKLCGITPLPLLFRSVFDPKTQVFRPVLAKRPGLPSPIDLDGTFDTSPAPKSLVSHVAPSGASRSAGDQNQAASLRLPREAVDGDPKTAWTPFPSNGAGEFASFRLSAGAYGVTRIGIRSLPETGSTDASQSHDRPKSLLVVTEKTLYRLKFSKDPATEPASTAWFNLPKPEKTSCMSVIVESSFDPSPKRLLPLSELNIMTEIDGPEGLPRLVKDLNNASLRREAAKLLKFSGVSALEPIRKKWKGLNVQGRRLAVDVLSDVAPVASIDLLVAVALGNDKTGASLAMRGLAKAPIEAVAALSKRLASPKKEVFKKAVEVLANLHTEQALNALVTVAGEGGRDRRIFLRDQLAVAVSGSHALSEKLWTHISRAQSNNKKEQLFDLIRVGDDLQVLKKRIGEMTVGLYDSSKEFQDRYRSLEILGSTGCQDHKDRLTAAVKDSDRHIRLIAVQGLAACAKDDKEVQLILKDALVDKEPLIRVKVLQTYAATGQGKDALAQITQLSKGDPWPEVRAATAMVARHLSVGQAFPIISQTAQDDSPEVREAAIGSAGAFTDSRFNPVIEARLSDDKEKPKLRAKAAFTAGIRCQRTALPHLFKVLQKGAEPLAAPEDIQAAVVAANAMGQIGGDEAKSLLKKAKQRSNLQTDKAIDAALANPGKRCRPN